MALTRTTDAKELQRLLQAHADALDAIVTRNPAPAALAAAAKDGKLAEFCKKKAQLEL